MAGKIFINYRRSDSIATAGRLHDRLAHTFGRKNLFMDVDHIPAGVDFVGYLNTQVAACDVFLAVIGPHWLDAKDDKGIRRVDKPEDFVTIEIAAALSRNVRVIPVLIDGARMPIADELPEALQELPRRNAVEVRNTQFGRDAEVLMVKIRDALRGAPARSSGLWWQVSSGAVALALAGILAARVAGITTAPWIEWIPWPWSAAKVVTNEETPKRPATPVDDMIAAYERKDYGTARALAEPLAKDGDAESQYVMAILYDDGLGGLSKDSYRAFDWYQKSASQGFAKAQFNLALMFDQGEGTPPDKTEAFKWYCRAAEKGFSAAQLNLGLIYRRGIGVERDEQLARAWLSKAATSEDTSIAQRAKTALEQK
jgi:hypothetical protein